MLGMEPGAMIGAIISSIFTIGIELIFLWLLFTLRASVFRIEHILSELEGRMESPDDREDREDRP